MVTEFWFFLVLVFHPMHGFVSDIHAHPTLQECEEARVLSHKMNAGVPGWRIARKCTHTKAYPGEFDNFKSPLEPDAPGGEERETERMEL